MDTLPTELHACICQSTCIDDGISIRTLNQVSKYFHEVSKPYLYHTVSAIGLDQILTLLDQLERTPPHLRHIRHLFLSNVPNTQPTTSPIRLTEAECFSMIRIITLSAPTLKIFSFIVNSPFSSTSIIGRLFRTSFPHLHTLAISGFYPFPSIPGKFPSLTHLHLDGNRNPQGLFQMSTLEDACPSLTDLKVSGLGAAASFLVELEEALTGGDIWDARSDSMTPTRLPPHVRRVTIQAGPEPSASMSIASRRTTAMKDKAMMARLDTLKTRKFTDGRRVQLSVLDRSVGAISVDDLRRDWLGSFSLAT